MADDSPLNLGDMPDEDKSFLQKEIERLNNNNAAIHAEFTSGLDNPETDELPAVAVRKQIADAAIAAIKSITRLASFAEAESVQLAASKYIVDLTLGNKGGMDAGDAKFAKLLEDLFSEPDKNKAEQITKLPE